MGNTQGLEKLSSNITIKDDSPMPLRDELEERFAQLVVSYVQFLMLFGALTTELECLCILLASKLHCY